MQYFDTVLKTLNAVSNVRDLAHESKTYQFQVTSPGTLYLHSERAIVQVSRWNQPNIEIDMRLSAGFSWRVKTDQDAFGVYLVAVRRTLVGAFGQAHFVILAPYETHLVLRLTDGSVLLNNIEGTLEIPPFSTGQALLDGSS